MQICPKRRFGAGADGKGGPPRTPVREPSVRSPNQSQGQICVRQQVTIDALPKSAPGTNLCSCQICVWGKSAFGGCPQGVSPPVSTNAKSAFGTNLRLAGVLRGLPLPSAPAPNLRLGQISVWWASSGGWAFCQMKPGENADFAKTQILRKHRFDENVDFAKTQISRKRRFGKNADFAKTQF